MSQGEGSPGEGLTGAILVHHAQPLCLVLSLEGIEIQDAKKKEEGEKDVTKMPSSLPGSAMPKSQGHTQPDPPPHLRLSHSGPVQ